MDPLQKRSSTLISESSPMTSEETSQEVTAELLMLCLSDPNSSPGTNYPAPPKGLLQQRHRDGKTLQERQWERSASSLRKKIFLEHMRGRRLDLVVPYQV